MASTHEISRTQITVLNVSLLMNILLMLGIILGGLNWVSNVSVYIDKEKNLEQEVAILRQKVMDMEKRHVIEDAQRDKNISDLQYEDRRRKGGK
jgi:hypothetical protein